jgi:RNA polymerase primary sigma factor
MEGFREDTGALALEIDDELSARPAQAPGEDETSAPERPTGAQGEIALSLAIQHSLRGLFEVIVDFGLAFDQVLALGEQLSSGEARLRSIVDVSADFDPNEEDADEASGGSPIARRTAATFRRCAKLREAWVRSGDAFRRARVVDAVQALSIHPQQLRRIDEAIGRILSAINDAERALSRELKGRRLKVVPKTASAWGRAARPQLMSGATGHRATQIRRFLEVLRQVEREAGEPLYAVREHALRLREAHAGLERAKNDMFRANLHMVRSMAAKLVNRGLDLTDLLQEGSVGLMRAVERFDHRRGFRFATYASWWVRQAMTRAIADQARTIRVPVHMNEQLVRLRHLSGLLAQKLGREATLDELADAAGISPEKATRALEHLRPTMSLDEPVSADSETTQLELVPDVSSPAPSAKIEDRELEQLLDQALAHLTPREQKVIRLRFGLGARERETLEEIGTSLGITRERTRQIEAQALRKLKRQGEDLGLEALLA